MNEEEEEEEFENVMDNSEEGSESDENMNDNSLLFNKIQHRELKANIKNLYAKVNKETLLIGTYLDESINNFHKLFDNNLNSFNEVLKHLEKISIDNKCVCSAVIGNKPAWRCIDCCKYESAIYCSNCYIKSKNLHKNHKLYYLYSTGGMCDCGDPDSLNIFCPEHKGPFSDQNKIDSYISSIFSKETLCNLNKFFDEFFLKFSKYFMLTAQCELFCKSKFEEYFSNISEEINNQYIEKNEITIIKNNFCIIFQNLINFFRLLSSKNLAMLNILAKYFLKNHLKEYNKEDNEEYKTTHSCIKISENNIEILYNNNNNIPMDIEKEDNINKDNNNNNINNNKHICECPFLRLLILNWRDAITSKNKDNEEFLLSFPRNLPLKSAFCILFFFDYNQIIINNNSTLLNNKSQFFSEETTVLIAEKTTFIEDSFDIFYNHFLKIMKQFRLKNDNVYHNYIRELYYLSIYKDDDIEYFSKPKIRELTGVKISIIKRLIDCICLMHNEFEFKYIFPHPQFQNQGYSEDMLDLELRMLIITQKFNILLKWEKYELIKEIFEYIINKIINQKSEGIKQLKENEFSFHLTLYRCFGLLINYFCFNYAFYNKCSIIESISYFKKNFFKSQNEIKILTDIILNDYFKLFGFIGGTKNGFFNYYDEIELYYAIYLNYKKLLINDFCLIKYLIVINESNFSIISFLQKSNIENIYTLFEKIFLNIKNNNNNENCMIIEEDLLNKDNNNIINQWKYLIDLMINFMKDDSSPFCTFINEYENIISSKTKYELFENIRNNENTMKDLENILNEQIIHGIISQGNLIDLEKIKKYINDYLLTLFGEKKFNEILNELTLNKINKGKKLFYLKDTNLKYLDMNYYSSPKEKSSAQKYILDFKKDIIKPYNNYYYNCSELIFDFFKIVYEKILLNKENFELIILIVEKILNKDSEGDDMKLIRNNFFPSILNYLSVFGCINTESFIKFKKENKILMNKLNTLLSHCLENNKLFDNDLKEFIKDIIKQLKRYEIIDINLNNKKISLNNYDYNAHNIELLNEEDSNINTIKENTDNININNEKKIKVNNIKDRLKNLMKKNAKNFMDKASLDEKKLKSINDQSKKVEENNTTNSNEETMCFFCRNNIKLKSFKTPYGKPGLLFKDLFYINSIKSSVRSELYKLNNNIKNDKLNEIINNDNNINIIGNENKRITSCGHYFHLSCFNDALNDNKEYLNCPLCLKKINILIPPLHYFQKNNAFLKSEKINKIFNIKTKKKAYEIKKDSQLFNKIITDFIQQNISINIKLDKKINIKEHDLFIEEIFMNYISYINFLENIFYIEGTYFNKHQQIDTIQNYILSLRYLVKNNILDINNILNNIKNILSSIIKGPDKNENIFINYEQMHYINYLEKLLLLLSILFNYSQLKDIFIYIINFFLPYFSFWFYLRNLVAKNKFYTLDYKHKQSIDKKDLEAYFTTNNDYMLNNCFKYLLQKLLITKFITEEDNTAINEDILINFNQLSIEKILSLIGLDNLYDSLKKKNKDNINFNDIFKVLPKLINQDNAFYKEYGITFLYNRIFESLINGIKKKKNDKNLIKKEFIIQFVPLKFEFIHLDNNIFNVVENYLDKNCVICHKTPKYFYICLICGNKICDSYFSDEFYDHVEECTGEYCIYLKIYDLETALCYKHKKKNLYPLFVNEAGVGPMEKEIGNEFNLSKEKLKITLRNFICHNFN